MKLNLHILNEDLKEMQWKFQGNLVEKPIERYCSYSLFLSKLPEAFQKEVLYIVKAEILPKTFISKEIPSILCIGRPPQQWLCANCNLLYTEDPISELDLLNFVNQQFHQYQEWGNSLQEVLDQQLSIQELASRSAAIVQNGIYAQGAFFRVLCCDIISPEKETALYKDYIQETFLNSGDLLSSEDINLMVIDEEYNKAIHQIEPAIYSSELYDFRTLYYNIFIENTFIARICFDEILKPFTNKDYALIEIFGSYLKKRLLNSEMISFYHPKELEEILQNLLNHRHLLPEQKIAALLETFHWHMFDAYICLVLRLKAEDTTAALEPLALQFSKIVMQECYTIKENQIIFVCNLTQLRTTRDQLYAIILPFLRDNLLSAGISTTYHDFKNLYYYYQQAIIAGQIGEQKNPTQWYFKFEEYQLDYIIQKCTEKTIPEVLIPDGLKMLMDYDRKKKHNYTETLKLYLEHDRNIADTIRAAYMHRSTFLYQIKRIQEILQMDLEDPKVRLILQLAFEILASDTK